jgi:hypothetical protein
MCDFEHIQFDEGRIEILRAINLNQENKIQKFEKLELSYGNSIKFMSNSRNDRFGYMYHTWNAV